MRIFAGGNGLIVRTIRYGEKPLQILPVDAADGMVDVCVCGGGAGDVCVSGHVE